ncbi:hypothetical protein BH11PAT1_BH11PAT1_1480 [soil metagenome]
MFFMKEAIQYSPEWFKKQKIGAGKSAEALLPIVIDLVSPRSVVDVGCGVGMWLSTFKELGVKDILGIDGEWVRQDELHIPKEFFMPIDISKPFEITKKADLVISLEVGEHLAPESAKGFVKSLAKIAPVMLFSAAIPKQGGTMHLNEQWPEYWADLFKSEGYVAIDCIRRRVWTNPNVEYWYAQNTILYVKESEIGNYPKLQKEIEHEHGGALPLVHPRKYFYALMPPPSLIFRIKRKIRLLARSLVS